MKKGCFLTVVITLTIIAGIIFYLIKNHSEIFENFARERVIEAANRELSNEMKNVDKSVYKDSLVVVIDNYIDEIKKEKFKKAMQNFSAIMNEAKSITGDHKVDSLEYKAFKILVERYERSKKN